MVFPTFIKTSKRASLSPTSSSTKEATRTANVVFPDDSTHHSTNTSYHNHNHMKKSTSTVSMTSLCSTTSSVRPTFKATHKVLDASRSHYIEDISETCWGEESCSSSCSSSHWTDLALCPRAAVEDFMHTLRRGIQTTMAHKNALQPHLQQCWALATARYAGGSTAAALVALRRRAKVQAEIARYAALQAAWMEILVKIDVELSCAMDLVQHDEHDDDDDDDMMMMRPEDDDNQVLVDVDLALHHETMKQVQRDILNAPPAALPSDETLLAQLRAYMASHQS